MVLFSLAQFDTQVPNAWFVVGGLTEQQARMLMDAAPFVDIAVFGEGEQTFLELCQAKEKSIRR